MLSQCERSQAHRCSLQMFQEWKTLLLGYWETRGQSLQAWSSTALKRSADQNRAHTGKRGNFWAPVSGCTLTPTALNPMHRASPVQPSALSSPQITYKAYGTTHISSYTKEHYPASSFLVYQITSVISSYIYNGNSTLVRPSYYNSHTGSLWLAKLA